MISPSDINQCFVFDDISYIMLYVKCLIWKAEVGRITINALYQTILLFADSNDTILMSIIDLNIMMN